MQLLFKGNVINTNKQYTEEMKISKELKTLSNLLVAIIMVIGLNACDRYCMEGNGKIESEHRVVTDFSSIENNTGFDIKVTYDSVTSIRVDADENLMDLINTSVRNGKLIVDSDDGQCVQSYSSVLINIHTPELERIELNGSGSFDVYSFNCPDLTIRNTGSGDIEIRNLITEDITAILSGSGDVYLDGTGIEARYSVSGSGDINGFDMKVSNATVKNSGSGDVSCFVYDNLDVTLSGSGDVIYAGPSTLLIVQDDSGSGDIYERD
jgi:hypothetical protein